MLAAAGHGTDLRQVHRVCAHLLCQPTGGVADRAAGEQPHRQAGPGVGEPVDQGHRRLQPVPGVHGAAEHDRLEAVQVTDLGR